MALSDCPQCGRRVSSGASVCPECGHPLDRDAVAGTDSTVSRGGNFETPADAVAGSTDHTPEWWSRLPTWALFVFVFVGGSIVVVTGVIAAVVVVGAIFGDAEASNTVSPTTVTTVSDETTTTAAETTTTSVPTTRTSSASTTTATGSETDGRTTYPSGTDLIFGVDTDWSHEGGWVSEYLSESDVTLVVVEGGAKSFTEDGTAVGEWERLVVDGTTTNLIVIDRACTDAQCTSEILYLADDSSDHRRSIWVVVDDQGSYSQALAFQFRVDEADGQACWSHFYDGPVVPTTDGYEIQRVWVYADIDTGPEWYIADRDELDAEIMSDFSMGLYPDWVQC